MPDTNHTTAAKVRTADEFAAASCGADLIPGNLRTLAALTAELDHHGARQADVVEMLARTTPAMWVGVAAAAFTAHRRAVVECADRWDDALRTVIRALDDHQHALARAQDTATAALALWREAHQRAATARRYPTHQPAVDAGLTAARRRAHQLLRKARTQLTQAGDDTATTIHHATQALRDAALPPLHHTPKPAARHPAGRTVTVRPARDGVHDTLWRIAARELGDPHRWPEIYHLNAGHPVDTHGTILTNPHYLRPGWTLHLPDGTPIVNPTQPPMPPAPQPRSAPEPSPVPQPPSAPLAPGTPPAPDRSAVTSTPGGGLDLLTGGFVATGLAGTVTAAMLMLRRRRRRTYRPGGSNRESSPPVAPVVRALRLAADDRHLAHNGIDAPVTADNATSGDDEPAQPSTGRTDAPSDVNTGVPLAVGDSRVHATDLAALHGLGITGSGAEAAVRALLVHLLATTVTTVVIPRPDAIRLLGCELPDCPALQITDDLDTAITRVSSEPADTQTTTVHTVLVAGADPTQPALQSLLDNGADRGIAGIVLGHWPAGSTLRVDADGIITATSPTLPDHLLGGRMFHLDAHDTRDLITLLTEARPTRPQPPTTHPSYAAEATPPTVKGDTTESPHAAGDTPERPDPLQRHRDHDPQVAPPTSDSGATAPTEEPLGPRAPYTLTVLGQPTLVYRTGDSERDLTPRLAPKHRALLVFLALYPRGTTRDVVREALWPQAHGRRPFNAYYATLSQIRKIFTDIEADPHAPTSTNLIVHQGQRIGLNPNAVEVDYWAFDDAHHAARIATTDTDRLTAWSRIIACYHGDLADGSTHLWLDGPREAAHRTAVDALAGMAAHYRETDPQRHLQLLEHARLLNPENEDIYRDIMRAQAELGLTDAISRTYHLLATALAETGDRPSTATSTLARALQARQHHRTAIN